MVLSPDLSDMVRRFPLYLAFAPEIMALPGRNLFVSANEDDGTIDIFRAVR